MNQPEHTRVLSTIEDCLAESPSADPAVYWPNMARNTLSAILLTWSLQLPSSPAVSIRTSLIHATLADYDLFAEAVHAINEGSSPHHAAAKRTLTEILSLWETDGRDMARRRYSTLLQGLRAKIHELNALAS